MAEPKTVPVEQTIADLRASARELRASGWVQGETITDAGCVCIGGALLVAIGGPVYAATGSESSGYGSDSDLRFCAAALAVEQYLARTVSWGSDLVAWNDEECKDGEQAAATLEATAAALEAGVGGEPR